MTQQDDITQRVLTDDEINTAIDWPAANTTMRAENDRAMAREVEAAVLRKLSKLRAPKPLGDRCHHCGWMDWVSNDGAVHCQACGKPHGSVPAEGLPNLPQLLRENADLDAAEGGNPDVVALEWAAADEIERLRREVSKLRAPVADERAAQEYGSPADVAQRIEQYLAQDGRMNSGTQLLYEAMKALRASQGDRNDG